MTRIHNRTSMSDKVECTNSDLKMNNFQSEIDPSSDILPSGPWTFAKTTTPTNFWK